MNRSILLSALASLTLLSCSGPRGSGAFPGVMDTPLQVSLPRLSRYYTERSDSLILPVSADSIPGGKALKFSWDPYNKMRILAPFWTPLSDVQALFTFDQDRFLRESGEPDLLSALKNWYSRFPFDDQKQTIRPPYRTLAAWGSLLHPPIKNLTLPLPSYHSLFTESFKPAHDSSAYFDPEFQKSLDRETQTVLTYGNRLRALFNGCESYPEKLRLARSATKFLYVAVMTVVADETGRELIRIMVERKRAGVDVRLITDDFYTFSISSFAVGVLEREGIPVAHVKDKRLNQMDRMFHNKIWIRDGEEAILGGMNVLDYENLADGFNFLNRDTDILIRGPAVTSLLENFIKLWKRYDREDRPIVVGQEVLTRQLAAEAAAGVRGSEHYARWLGDPETRMNGICRTAVQGDDADPQKIVTLLTRYVGAARRSFYMTSPEIEFELTRVPPFSIDLLARAMMEKARVPGFYLAYITNGVDGGLGESSAFLRSRVKDSRLAGEPLWEDMLTPMIDHEGREVNRRVRHTIAPMLEAGVHGFQYFNYVHAKEFYFDRTLVGIGSWNFDSYSADNNHESAIFCLDDSLRVQIERQLIMDMVNSVPILPPAGRHP